MTVWSFLSVAVAFAHNSNHRTARIVCFMFPPKLPPIINDLTPSTDPEANPMSRKNGETWGTQISSAQAIDRATFSLLPPHSPSYTRNVCPPRPGTVPAPACFSRESDLHSYRRLLR